MSNRPRAVDFLDREEENSEEIIAGEKNFSDEEPLVLSGNEYESEAETGGVEVEEFEGGEQEAKVVETLPSGAISKGSHLDYFYNLLIFVCR